MSAGLADRVSHGPKHRCTTGGHPALCSSLPCTSYWQSPAPPASSSRRARTATAPIEVRRAQRPRRARERSEAVMCVGGANHVERG